MATMARYGPNATRSAARIVGALFILATVASLVSTALLNPVLNSTGYLATIDGHQGRLITGALFKIVAGFASAGIAMAFYPVLRERQSRSRDRLGRLPAHGGRALCRRCCRGVAPDPPEPGLHGSGGSRAFVLQHDRRAAALIPRSHQPRRDSRLLRRRFDVLLHPLSIEVGPSLAVGLGRCRVRTGFGGRPPRTVPGRRVSLGHADCVEPAHRGERDGVGRVAAREGIRLVRHGRTSRPCHQRPPCPMDRRPLEHCGPPWCDPARRQ